MMFQTVILPVIYKIYATKEIRPNTVILADAHHEEMPFSMRALKQELDRHPELIVQEMYWNNGSCSGIKLLRNMVQFMKTYATTETVVICDNFLPASSCKKREGTKVIQLWHACGAFKKFGYDTTEDIPAYYMGNVQANCSLVTVSAPACIGPFASAMRLPEMRISPIGVSRTDLYFSSDYNQACRERFFLCYPEAKGKKIVLWAPTFRGNPSMARVEGITDIYEAAETLKETHYFIIKLHPHTQMYVKGKSCPIITEELLPVSDIIITDYSSIIFDALIYKLPLVLFVPDYDEYMKSRGLYLDYESIPGVKVYNKKKLIEVLKAEQLLTQSIGQDYDMFCKKYMSACDGHATDRIVKKVWG